MESTALVAMPFAPDHPRTAYRRLSKDLREVEARLTSWGRWTRQREQGGYPTRWVTGKAGEGGIAAGSPRPPTELPDEVADVDRCIAKLPLHWQNAARANWQYGELTREMRASRAGMTEATFRRRIEGVRDAVRRELRL